MHSTALLLTVRSRAYEVPRGLHPGLRRLPPADEPGAVELHSLPRSTLSTLICMQLSRMGTVS